MNWKSGLSRIWLTLFITWEGLCVAGLIIDGGWYIHALNRGETYDLDSYRYFALLSVGLMILGFLVHRAVAWVSQGFTQD